MTRDVSWKEKHFELLVGLKQCCDNNDIPLFLFGDTALAAWRDNELADDIVVCTDIKYAGTLLKILGDRTESMKTHEGYPYFEIRYFDPGTIDYNAANLDKYENQCLAVKIKFIQHVPAPDQLKQLRKMHGDYKKGKGKSASEVFDAMCEGYNNDSRVVAINGKQMPAGLFDRPMPVAIREETFYIPENIEVFFIAQYGTEWAASQISPYKEGAARFRDGEHAYSEYKASLHGFDPEGYIAAKKKYDDLSKQYNEIHALMKQDYAFMERTHYRYMLHSQYMPQKPQLLELANDGKWGELATMLADYFSALEICRKKGLGLCFDAELFDAAMATLEAIGRSEDAAVYKAMVPPSHRDPLVITDYKGDAL